MKRGMDPGILVAVLLAGLIMYPLGADEGPASSDFDHWVSRRLGESVPLLQALTTLEQARVRHRQLSAFWLPTLSVGTTGNSGFPLVQNGEFPGGTLRAELGLGPFLGADLSLQAPVSLGAEGEWQPGALSLGVSRRLFNEAPADILAAEAQLIRARQGLRDARATAWIQAFQEFFDYAHARRSRALSQEALAMAEAAVDNSGPMAQREAERRRLQVRRELFQAPTVLAPVETAQADRWYPGALARLQEISTRVEGLMPIATPPALGTAYQAQALELKAARIREELAFTVWLPNPLLSFQGQYDPWLGATAQGPGSSDPLTWSLSFSASWTILDRGERQQAVLARKNQVLIEEERLEQLARSEAASFRQLLDRREVLSIDLRLRAMDREDREAAWQQATRLGDRGFVSVGAVEEARLALARADLAWHQALVALGLHDVRILAAMGME